MLSYPVLATTLLLVLLGVVQVESQLWLEQSSLALALVSPQPLVLGSLQRLLALTDPLVESSSFFSALSVASVLQSCLFEAL